MHRVNNTAVPEYYFDRQLALAAIVTCGRRAVDTPGLCYLTNNDAYYHYAVDSAQINTE